MNTYPSHASHAFNRFGSFVFPSYFAHRYNIIPSRLALYVNVKNKKDHFRQALDMIDLEKYGLRLLNKRWNISKNKNDDPKADYEYARNYACENLPLALEIDLSGGELSLEFFYDCTRPELEDWIREQILAVRNAFGVEKSPVFRVLKSTEAGFDTEKVNIDCFAVDLAASYNDDFPPVALTIDESITAKRSGLILLYGKPGTGKTSYIKSLITEHVEEKFIFVPNDFVNELLKPAFVTFLIRQRNAILVIEDAEKIITSREHVNGHSVVSTILQLTDGLFSDYLNIKVICTFNTDRSKIDKALLRKGRMIASYDFKALSVEKSRALLKGQDVEVEGPMTLAEIYNVAEVDFAAEPEAVGIGFRR